MMLRAHKNVTRGIALLAASAFIAVGCGDDSDSKSDSKDDNPNAAMTDDMEMAQSSLISSPGTDLRVTLDRLLAEHAALAFVGLSKTIAGEADAEAAVAGLTANTEELTDAISSIYGDEAGQAFKTQWDAHIGFFVNYATGIATKDEAMKEKAVADLGGYSKSFAKFLNEAAGLDAKAAEGALDMHVAGLAQALDAYAEGDYDEAYKLQREAYSHMFGTGDALAAAITAQKPEEFGTGDVTKAAADTRVAVNRLLAEHAFLAAVATTESLQGTKDAAAAVTALDANSNELGDVIGSVYGEEAKKAFLTQWKAHIGFFVDYTTALASKDDAKKKKAGEDLAGYTESFAKFLADATGGDQDAFKGALDKHVADLASALDAAAAGDLNKAWELERDAYAHMFMTGDALVEAIVKQNPDKFGGEASGGGDTTEGQAMEGDEMEAMEQ